MESIFKITPTISTVEEGLLKISVVLSTKTTNDKPYWLPHPIDKSVPIKVTMRIQAMMINMITIFILSRKQM